MRISDWSSDVCSSDLLGLLRHLAGGLRGRGGGGHALDGCATEHGQCLVVRCRLPQAWVSQISSSRLRSAGGCSRACRIAFNPASPRIASPPNSHAASTYSATARWLRRPCSRQWRTRSSISPRSEEHTSELQSLMRISYAVFCLKKKKKMQK